MEADTALETRQRPCFAQNSKKDARVRSRKDASVEDQDGRYVGSVVSVEGVERAASQSGGPRRFREERNNGIIPKATDLPRFFKYPQAFIF